MITDLVRTIEGMGPPVMVVDIPSGEELLRGESEAPPPIDTQPFAALLGGRLLGGKRVFSGRSADEIRGMWCLTTRTGVRPGPPSSLASWLKCPTPGPSETLLSAGPTRRCTPAGLTGRLE